MAEFSAKHLLNIVFFSVQLLTPIFIKVNTVNIVQILLFSAVFSVTWSFRNDIEHFDIEYWYWTL